MPRLTVVPDRLPGARWLEVVALQVPLPVRLVVGVLLGVLAVVVAVALDLSLAWALLPALLATILAIEFVGVRPAIATTLASSLGMAWSVFPPSGLTVSDGADQARLAVYVIVAAVIIATGGRFRHLAKLLMAANLAQRHQQEELEATWANLDALTDAAPAGMCLVDNQMRFVKVNPELARLNGMSVEEHIGRAVDAVSGLDAFAVDAFRSVLAGGPPIRDRELSSTPLLGGGRTQHVVASWFAVHAADGGIIGAGALVQDITRRKVAEERLWLLAELSDMLEEPLDTTARSQSLAQLLVPRLADLCLVMSDGTNEPPHLRAIACHDPARGVLAADVVERYPEAQARSQVFAQVLAGETVVVNDYAPARDAVSPSHLEALRALGVGALACLPIAAGGRTHGIVLLAKFAPTVGFDAGEVTFAQTVIARAAVGLDNAYLYDRMASLAEQEHERAELLASMEARQRYIADTLQRSLLPAEFPELPSLALASAFRPAGVGLEVGGDTFDLFDAGEHWVAYVADVCGKGPQAAARTGLVRHTVRAEARHDADPVQLLRLVNAAMLRSTDADADADASTFATMAVVTLHRRADGDLDAVVASGGHPPAVLLRDGRASEVVVEGTVVGAFDDARFTSRRLRLQPGDVLLLYTDGVTEARAAGDTRHARPELYGDDRLLDSLERAHHRGVAHAQGLVDALVEDIDIFSGRRLHDDLAILALQVLPAVAAVAGREAPVSRATPTDRTTELPRGRGASSQAS